MRRSAFGRTGWRVSEIAFGGWPTVSLFPAGAATSTAFIARVPFDSGALIGNWTEDTYAGWPPGSVPRTLRNPAVFYK